MSSTRFILSAALAACVVLCSTACTSKAPPSGKSAFIDIHEFGPGKVTAGAVAVAHQKDLAVQAKRDVRFLNYWVDEEHGTVYCLSEANDAHSIADTHREAHGLLPAQILPVTGGQAVMPTGTKTLYLDIHELGAGNVTAEAVAEAHEKDLQAQGRFGVNFINYWVDETNGKVICLSEAPNPEAIRETHRHAHGLLPVLIAKVSAAE